VQIIDLNNDNNPDLAIDQDGILCVGIGG
jgi:hypothetical protein